MLFFNHQNEAVKSSAIVSSLFPQNVRARLYGTEGQDDTSYTDSQKNQQNLLMIDSFEDRGRSLVERSVSTGRPIADLFPSATVIFGDLAGFTAWSSTREPSQVFILLESLYRLFDALATKRKVFKVETIGDCYMAVVGLPGKLLFENDLEQIFLPHKTWLPVLV